MRNAESNDEKKARHPKIARNLKTPRVGVSFAEQIGDSVVADKRAGLTNVKRRGVVGVAGAGVSRLEDEAGSAGVLDDVTPTGIGDIVGGAQHGRRWISITVCPVPDPLPLPGTAIGAGHAAWPTRLHFRQTRLPLAAANRGAVCVLYAERRASLQFHPQSKNKISTNYHLFVFKRER